MREWLVLATNVAVDAIDWLALILIVVGAIEAFFLGLWTMFSSRAGHYEREVWLRLGRWLVAGLTFQLAADVLETAITTSWDEVARLAAIAAIHTFLNTFSNVTWARSELGRDQHKMAATEVVSTGGAAGHAHAETHHSANVPRLLARGPRAGNRNARQGRRR